MSKQYYDSIFAKDEDFHWEGAPGKDVLITTLKHLYATKQLVDGAKIVDIGCGTGFFLNCIAQIAQEGFVLSGIDISDRAIAKGQKRYPYLRLCSGDGAATPFLANEFDALVSYGSYEHFPDPARALREASRILKEGGHVLAMMPTLGVDRMDREDEGWYEERQVVGSPICQMQWNFKRSTWEKAFNDAGIELDDVSVSARFGALRPGVFFFGKKRIEDSP